MEIMCEWLKNSQFPDEEWSSACVFSFFFGHEIVKWLLLNAEFGSFFVLTSGFRLGPTPGRWGSESRACAGTLMGSHLTVPSQTFVNCSGQIITQSGDTEKKKASTLTDNITSSYDVHMRLIVWMYGLGSMCCSTNHSVNLTVWTTALM